MFALFIRVLFVGDIAPTVCLVTECGFSAVIDDDNDNDELLL